MGLHCIPCLMPRADSLGTYFSIQPIMCLKELEPDRVRWESWKSWCKRVREAASKKRRKRRTA